MLTGFREWAKGFASKILLGFIVLTFAVWGIGDIFRGSGETEVATVGDETISQRQLDMLVDRLQRSYAQITPELAADPQFRVQALTNLVDNLLLEQEAEALGLRYSRETLATYIARNPMFQQEDGSFNRELFETVLRQNGWGEREYLRRLADDLRTALLRDTISAGITPPEAMVKTMHAIRGETLEASLILIDEPEAGALKTADEETLRSLYEQHTMRYTTPERRSFRYVHFDVETALEALGLRPSKTLLRERYEAQADEFIQPEMRGVEQLLLADEETATKLHEQLEPGASLTTMRDNDGVLNPDNIDLGTIGKSELPVAVVDTVFALEENAISEPVESDFGWHIFRVTAIEPEKKLSFEEAKDRLLEAYRRARSEEAMNDLANRLEDAIAGGAGLEDALKQAGLQDIAIMSLDSVAADGTSDDQLVPTLSPIEEEVLELGFSLEQGAVSPLSLAENGEYFMVGVREVTPSALQPFDAVRKQVEAQYRKQHRRQALREQADEAAAMLADTANPEAAARAAGYSLHASGPLQRMDDTVANPSQLKDKILTSGFVKELFRLTKGKTTGAYPLPSGEYVIGIVTAVNEAPKPTHEALQTLETELTNQLSNDVLALYMAHLKQAYEVDVKINAIMPGGMEAQQ